MSWESFCDSVRRAADRAAEKLNQTADLAALQVKLSMAESRLKDAYTELGRLAYSHLSREGELTEEVSAAMKKVESCLAECKTLQDKIAEQKKQAAGENPAQEQTASAEEPDTAE